MIEGLIITHHRTPSHTISKEDLERLGKYLRHLSKKTTKTGILYYQQILKGDTGRTIVQDTITLYIEPDLGIGSVHVKTLPSIFQDHVNISLELSCINTDGTMMMEVDYLQE